MTYLLVIIFIPLTPAHAWQDSTLAVGTFGSNGNTTAMSTATDASGNIYVAGFFEYTVDFDISSGTLNKTSTGSYDAFVTKYTSNGNILWNKLFTGPNSQVAYDLTLDSNQNVLITGRFSGSTDLDPSSSYDTKTAVGGHDIFVAKLSNNGEYLWSKVFGGSTAEEVHSIATDSAGNVLVTGNFDTTVDFNPGAGVNSLAKIGTVDRFLLKLDLNGNYLWALQIPNGNQFVGGSVQVNAFDEIYLAGTFTGTVDLNPGAGTASYSSAGFRDSYLIKFTASGAYTWAKTFSGNGDKNSRSLAIDSAGNLYIAGEFQNAMDADPGVSVETLTSLGSYEIFIIKLDSSGNKIWSRRMGTSAEEYVYSISVDSNSNLFIGGRFFGTTDLNPGVGVVSASTIGSADAYILKLDSSGNYLWSKNFGSTGAETVEDVAIDPSGNGIFVGSFGGTTDFDFTSGVANINSISNSSYNAFIIKLSPDGDTEPSGPKTAPNFTFALGAGTITKITYRTNFNIVVNSDVAGKVTLVANGKKIAGCISKPITTSYTCVFKSSIRGAIMVSATLTPTVTADYTSATTGLMTLLSAARTNYR